MRVLHVGATGTVGSAVVAALEAAGHEVVRVGRSNGDHTVDLGDPGSVAALYEAAGPVDAVVCTAGIARFGQLDQLDDDAFESSLRNKLMGQVNLVRFGVGRVSKGGSFTLTSGTLSTKPEPGTVAVSMASAALEAFAKAAALDLDGRYRVNVVSPTSVAESRRKMGLDPMPGIWAADLAEYYVRCVEGDASGITFVAEGPIE